MYQFRTTSCAYGQRMFEGGSTWVESTSIPGFFLSCNSKTSFSILKNSSKLRVDFLSSLEMARSLSYDCMRDSLYLLLSMRSSWGWQELKTVRIMRTWLLVSPWLRYLCMGKLGSGGGWCDSDCPMSVGQKLRIIDLVQQNEANNQKSQC